MVRFMQIYKQDLAKYIHPLWRLGFRTLGAVAAVFNTAALAALEIPALEAHALEVLCKAHQGLEHFAFGSCQCGCSQCQ